MFCNTCTAAASGACFELILSKKMIGDVATIIDYLLVALLSGILILPRRSLDYALLKWRNYDNHYKRGKLYLNKHMTVIHMGWRSLMYQKNVLVFCKMIRKQYS
jgi:hypothetical protein